MNLNYVPLIPVMRELHKLPRSMARFRQYLRTIFPTDASADQLLPLLAMNPMGKDHVTALLDLPASILKYETPQTVKNALGLYQVANCHCMIAASARQRYRRRRNDAANNQ